MLLFIYLFVYLFLPYLMTILHTFLIIVYGDFGYSNIYLFIYLP